MAWKKLQQLREEFQATGRTIQQPHSHRGCKGKIRFETRALAYAHLLTIREEDKKSHLRRHFNRKSWQLEVYRCKGCTRFHVGHNKYADPSRHRSQGPVVGA